MSIIEIQISSPRCQRVSFVLARIGKMSRNIGKISRSIGRIVGRGRPLSDDGRLGSNSVSAITRQNFTGTPKVGQLCSSCYTEPVE